VNNLTILLIGSGVFSLLLTGLYFSAKEFIRVSDRPDIGKGSNVMPLRGIERDQAA
jgi:hypothetical protein